MEEFSKLLKLIEERKPKIGIIGAGYVGQSVARGALSVGFEVLCYDIDRSKITSINHQGLKNLSATDKFEDLKHRHVICICVPTPITKKKKPDLSILTKILTKLENQLQIGQLIIIESSVAPGTTRNLALPILECSKLKTGEDFFLAHSPERIDPGNFDFTIQNTPKIVSGIDDKSKKLAIAFYSTFVQKIVPVSTVEVAEMTKVLENTFRLVNISLINEVAAFAKASGIDIWEVIEAAATKPFGFLPHYPGPGAGGDCIPGLPRFLLEDAKACGIAMPLVETAWEVNEKRPAIIAEKALAVLNGTRKAKRTPKVLLVGIAYKAGNDDT